MATYFESSGQNDSMQRDIHSSIKEGMLVVDANNLPVGVITASFLHHHATVTESEQETLGAPAIGDAENGTNGTRLIPTIAGNFLGGEKLPELLYVRLQRTGFLRVERPGLYSHTYYVTPDQIERVFTNRVRLGVARETLLSF